MVVDDRVVALDSGVPRNMRGKQGIVLWHQTGPINNQCLVQFDEFVGGHDGGGVFGSPKGLVGHCYWIIEKSLRLENNEEFLEENPNKWWLEESAKWGSKRDNSRVERNGQFFIGNMVKPKGFIVDSMIGKTGKIIDIHAGFCLVEFEENFGGHNGSGHHAGGPLCKIGYCWWIPYKLLYYADENYGLEEDEPNKWWLDEKLIINEEYENDVVFKIGDRVVGKSRYAPQYNKVGTIVYIDKGYNGYLVEYDENMGGHDGGTSDYKGKPGHCWWEAKKDINLSGGVDDRFIYEDDPNKWWLEEGFLIKESSSNKIDMKKIHPVYIEFNSSREMRKIATYLDENGIRVVSYDSIMEEPMDDDYTFFKSVERDGYYQFVRTNKCDTYKTVSFDFFKKIKKRIKNKNIDPFDEEVWGFETNESIFSDAKLYQILIANKKEYDFVMKKLEEDECLWKGGQRPTEWPYKGGRRILSIHNKKIGSTRDEDSDVNYLIRAGVIPASEFLKYDNMKRKTNFDADPFGEENWGYEEMNESIFSVATYYEIVVRNHEEFDFVMEELEKEGCRWAGGGQAATDWRYAGGDRVVIVRDKKITCPPLYNYMNYDFGDKEFMEARDFMIPPLYNKIEEDEKDKWWLNEDISNEDSFIMWDIYKKEGTWERVLNYLKNNLIGKFVKFNGKMKDDHGFMDFEKFVSDVIFTGSHFLFTCEDGEYMISLKDPIRVLGLKKKKILDLENDPFGEENWGYEEMNESYFSEENVHMVVVKNKDEYDFVMRKLEEDGFVWASHHLPTEWPYAGGIRVIIINEKEKTITSSSMNKNRLERVYKGSYFIDAEAFLDHGIKEPEEDNKWWNESVKNYNDFLFEYEGGPPTKDPTKIGDRMITEIDIEEDDDEDEDNDGTLKVLNDEIRLDESRCSTKFFFRW